MPEMIEVEFYRRHGAATVNRTITAVSAPDAWVLKRGTTAGSLRTALVGRRITAARRIGKLMLLDTDRDGPTVGLRYGMTGRIEVDGHAPIQELIYGSTRENPAWDRFALTFAGGGSLVIKDPRRLGGVELEPDEDRLGPDALAVTPAQLRAAVGTSAAPLKACLLDQHRVAGIGNLICDETLWRAALDPARPGRALSVAEHRRLHRRLRSTIEDLLERGGSHTGDLQEARTRGGICPADGHPLDRRTIGGRTTYSCPHHQH